MKLVVISSKKKHPLHASLYPSDITDESILLDREKNKVEDFKGSNFIREDEKSFLLAVPHVEGVFTVVLIEGITDESETVHIMRNVKIVN